MDVIMHHSFKHVSGCCWLPRGLSLSTMLFIIFMKRISRHSCGEENVWVRSLRIASVQFFNDSFSVGFIILWLSAFTGVVCRQVWSGWDKGQHLRVLRNGCLLENDNLGWIFCSKSRILSILRTCSWVRVWWSKRLANRIVAKREVNWKAFNLPVYLPSDHHQNS